MRIGKKILEEIYAHSEEGDELEVCGVLIVVKGKMRYKRIRNVSHDPKNMFDMHPKDLFNAEEEGEIIAYVHSHPTSKPEPSWADLDGIEATKKPWVIVNHRIRHYTVTKPSGWVTPLIGREFVHGVHDCFGLARDYYKQVKNVNLPNFERQDEWWEKGENLFVENFEKAGFKEIPFEQLREGDAILMQFASNVPNHCAIYVGDNKILHHSTGRLSTYDILGGGWIRCITHCLRYKDA